jgi:hypothetical protein
LLRDEIVDRLQAEFLIQGQQVHVQHEQIPPHGHHLVVLVPMMQGACSGQPWLAVMPCHIFGR